VPPFERNFDPLPKRELTVPEEEITFSRKERYFLSILLQILEQMNPEEADNIAVQREALERGYEMIYRWGLDHIYDGDDRMTYDESSEVWSTLDMFSSIARSAPPDQEDAYRAKFRGYDGNNETKFMAFTAFTIERLERFEYVPMEKEGYFNSHMPMRDVYSRMLRVWQNIPSNSRFEMDKKQVTSVLRAATQPENQ